MRLELICLAGMAVPFVVITAIVIESIWRTGERFAIQKKRRAQIAYLPEAVRMTVAGRKEKKKTMLHTWSDYTGQQIKRAGWKISPAMLAFISAMLALAGMAGVYSLTGDLMMTITSAIMLIFIPTLLLNWTIQKHDQRIIDQLPIAIQLFSVEYQIVKNIKESLQRASKAVGKPLNKYIDQCARELGSSRPYREVFQRLAKNLNCEYGRLWAQMLFASTEDATVVKLMPRLITRLSGQRILQQKNISELSKERRIGILLNVLILPGLMLAYTLFPQDTSKFYTTPLGKIVIMLVFLSVLVGIMLDQLLKKIDF